MAGGTFYGYRELLEKPVGRVQLGIWELDGKIPTTNLTFAGSALDAYPAMQILAIQSEIILIQSWEAVLDVKLSTDGVNYQDQFEVDPDLKLGSWFHRYSALGFTVKNNAAGLTAKYQVVVFT